MPQTSTASRTAEDEAALLPDHRALRDDEWWREIPGWRELSSERFHDGRWQIRNAVTTPAQLMELLGERVSEAFWRDMWAGLALSPMNIRVSPYIVSLIDWDDPANDPLRRQFLPLASEQEPDHPMSTLDALEEQRDAAAPGLTHRYPDKVLFLALDVCPVYCRYCTRSYSIGSSTAQVDDKLSFRPNRERWEKAFAYIRSTPTVEDVVVSGGDVYLLTGQRLRHILDELLTIPHVRRIRLATKGIAVQPQNVLTDEAWFTAIAEGAAKARRQGVQLAVHTHFAHPTEITETSRQACARLFAEGVIVRNQNVLLRGVNDDITTMTTLIRRLSWINVQPYYVYVHDMVPGVEHLRTSLRAALELEKNVRGATAGFMTPTFVCDAVGGGGKRDVHSFEHYDETRGIAIYRSPVVDADRQYYYFDPLRSLPNHVQQGWRNSASRKQILDRAREQARRVLG